MLDKRLNTPILLIGFNRPDLMKGAIDRLRVVKPTKLYVGIDGARNEVENMVVDEVKELIKAVDWECEVKTNFQKSNLGCKNGPLAAINWFFECEEMGIILEDDIEAEESFFRYCQELLIKYKNDERMGTISGDNYTEITDENSSYMLSRYSQTWGWATWKRVWVKYDDQISNWPKDKETGWLNKLFDNRWVVIYWTLIFEAVYNKEIKTAWDYQWTYMSWKNNLWTIIPSKNLVTNVGIGIDGATHTKLKSKLYQFPKYKMGLPLVHPKSLKINTELDKYIQKNNYVLWKEVVMNLVRKWRAINSKRCSAVN